MEVAMSESLPVSFLNMLPLPLVIVKHCDDTLNFPIVFANDRFKEVIGWELSEIPDKDAWWQKAYPSSSYQKVVQNQWELIMESVDPHSESSVVMTVNIRTKHKGTKRFNVYSEISFGLLPGHYAVAFEEVAPEDSEDS